MPTAKITSKGQLTLPKEIRRALRLKQGDKVRFFLKEKGEYYLESVTTDIKKLKGSLPKPKHPVTLEQMEKAIKKRKRL